METTQLIILVQTVIIIALTYAQHKSIPVDQATKLIGSAKDFASKTETTLDDSAVGLAEWLFNLYKEQSPKEDPNKTTPIPEQDIVDAIASEADALKKSGLSVGG